MKGAENAKLERGREMELGQCQIDKLNSPLGSINKFKILLSSNRNTTAYRSKDVPVDGTYIALNNVVTTTT